MDRNDLKRRGRTDVRLDETWAMASFLFKISTIIEYSGLVVTTWGSVRYRTFSYCIYIYSCSLQRRAGLEGTRHIGLVRSHQNAFIMV